MRSSLCEDGLPMPWSTRVLREGMQKGGRRWWWWWWCGWRWG